MNDSPISQTVMRAHEINRQAKAAQLPPEVSAALVLADALINHLGPRLDTIAERLERW